MGIAIGPNISTDEMVTEGKYQLTFQDGTEVQGILKRKLFGDTYIFENIKGGEELVSGSNSIELGLNEFPYPLGLNKYTTFKVVM